MEVHINLDSNSLQQQVVSRVATLIEGLGKFLLSSELELYIGESLHDKPLSKSIQQMQKGIKKEDWKAVKDTLEDIDEDLSAYPVFLQEMIESVWHDLMDCLNYLCGEFPEELMLKRMEEVFKGETQ